MKLKKSILIILIVFIFLLLTYAFIFTKSDKTEKPISIPSPTVNEPFIRVVAVGDIMCPEQTHGKPCSEEGISKIISGLRPQAILIPGDSQYEKGTYGEYRKYFENFLGKYKSLIYPVPGNHDYYSYGASGYFDYFNGLGNNFGRAGERGKGYYSFDLGDWHFIALNSNCSAIGCHKGSQQEKWLLSDLASNQKSCILAYYHEPLFSSGPHGRNIALWEIWGDLSSYGVDIVINGHDHDYERFKKLDTKGKVNAGGIREFVVGTGGSLLYRFMNYEENSEIKDAGSHGLLELKLYKDRYEWNFHSVEGDNFRDSGSDKCNQTNA